MFGNKYRYLFILVLSLYTFLNTVLCDVYYYFNITIDWYYALLTITGVTLLTWEGNRLAESGLKYITAIKNSRTKKLVIGFLAGNIIAALSAFTMVWLVGKLLHQYNWAQYANPLKLNLIYAALINLLFHLLNAMFVLFREYKRKTKEAEDLRITTTQTQLQLIRSQVNPHFLFNNLNVLSAMVIKDNPDANEFVEKFAKVYRYILQEQDKELVPLEDELQYIDPYIYLLKKRFSDGLSVSVSIAEEHKRKQIVPASLQILIENAVKHNIVSSSRPLHIDIHTNGNNTLVVSNNLQPKQVIEPSSSIGLQNIYKRYELVGSRNVAIKKTATVFEVALPLLHVN